MPACSSLVGGVFQVLDEDILQRAAIDIRRRDAGQAIDLRTIERLRVSDCCIDAFPEFLDAVGQHGDAALALAPVARRQVEQHLGKPVLLQPRRHHLRRMIIRADIFDGLEAGAGGRVETVEKLMLAKEHREIG